MGALVILITIVAVWAGYKFYAASIDRTVIRADAGKATPAKMYNDGVDFMPASSSVLFGYQFKSIAALGPIVGPIVAVQWGWLPAVLWLILGVFFIGWIQDYTSAMLAMRNDGLTMGGLSYKLISPRARTILLSFLYFYLLLIMGAFSAIVAGLFASPFLPFGFIVLTLCGVLAGQMTYKWRKDLVMTTVLTVVLSLVGIWLGTTGPLRAVVDWINGLNFVSYATPYGPMTWPVWFWGIVALGFCYLGSVLPIWRFAQPVNYVSFWLVLMGIVGSIIGILFTMPGFGDFPAFTGFMVKGIIAPGFDTPLWPILFVTIACGAISGWHSLVSTSGTARQLEKETDALPVGAGAMFTEAVLAILSVTFAVTAFGGFGGYMEKLTKGGGPGAVFADGMAKYLGVLGVPLTFGGAFGRAFLVIMALTVMQLVLRFMRVASAELVGDRMPAFRNVHFGTIVGILLTLVILWTGFWSRIWILFGGSNQLFAGLALVLITIWLAQTGKSYQWAMWPAIFMYVTTVAALIVTAWVSFQAAFTPGLKAAFVFGNVVSAVIGLALTILSLILAYDAVQAFGKARSLRPAAAKA
jgi:carbon starvation protein